MQELTKDSLVQLGDEVVTIQEYVARTFSKQVSEAMDDKHLAQVRDMAEKGATFDDLWPFYNEFIPQKTRDGMSFLEIDPRELFSRIHDACMARVMN